ncbi:response regulator transcription factor [Polluticoccus soli]|uniref:response regulator transcription factor n=1 Tax=Polluticoccus soli TaxID=3034150 RepID=UPI0023E257EB|nr:response regulator transcription factor [Flavipsychrobacter sp. JY13-12]
MNNPHAIHVAIADDHTVVRDSISKMIATFPGFRVTIEASNGKELIEQLKGTKPFPEICVLDIQMPDMNGYETMAYIKEKWPKLKVLALSMLDDEFAVIKMLKLGARGYIVKSSDLEELQKALNAIHDRGYYSSELVASNFFQLLNSDNDEALYKITEREQQFLKYCPTELTLKEIAQKMGVSTSTVQGYRNMLFDKLNLKTRQGLAIFAVKSGIVSFEDL